MISPILIGVLILAFVFGVVVFFGAPYVPSRKKYIERAFDYFKFGPRDVLVDIGSGDGVVLRSASKYGMKSVGYEINPILIFVSRVLSAGDRNVAVFLQNAWTAKLPDAVTVVYAFSVSRDEKKLITLLQSESNRLQKPLKLICYGSPFKCLRATDTFEAYHLYLFQPLQSKKA